MSALTNELGLVAIQIDPIGLANIAPLYAAAAIMDASTEKVAICGCVWHPTVKTGTINIRKIHFRCGAVTFNVLSAFQVSLQNISLTAGPPYQPDGVADQTVAIAGGGLTANGWNTTGALSADRAVDLAADSLGDANSRWLAVVFEETTFTALDSIIISAISGSVSGRRNIGGSALLNTGTWAGLANGGVIVLECDDGTFAFLRGCTPFSALSSASVSSTAAIRRAGWKFKYPTQRKISAASLLVNVPNGSDGRLVLYDSDGTSELISVDVDNDSVYSASDGTLSEVDFAPITLAADTYYRWVFVGGTATAATVNYGDVNAAGHMDGLVGGQNHHWTQADSAGTWTDTPTRRPHGGFGVSAVHDGAGGGGGMRLAGTGGLASGG